MRGGFVPQVSSLLVMGSFLGLKMPLGLTAPLAGSSAERMAPVVTAAGFSVPPQFGFVVLTASASVILTQWQMFQVCNASNLGVLNVFYLPDFEFVSVVNVGRRGCRGLRWIYFR